MPSIWQAGQSLAVLNYTYFVFVTLNPNPPPPLPPFSITIENSITFPLKHWLFFIYICCCLLKEIPVVSTANRIH